MSLKLDLTKLLLWLKFKLIALGMLKIEFFLNSILQQDFKILSDEEIWTKHEPYPFSQLWEFVYAGQQVSSIFSQHSIPQSLGMMSIIDAHAIATDKNK